MYATIRIYAGNSELGDELRRNQESVKSAMSAVPGFPVLLLRRRGGRRRNVRSPLLRRSGRRQDASNRAGWPQRIVKNLPGFSLAAPAISAGEVLIAF